MACKVALVLYTVILFVALALTTIGIPIDQFRFKKDRYVGSHSCITLWGFKPECFKGKVYTPREFYLGCSTRAYRFDFAQFFILLSLGLTVAAFVLGLIQLRCCHQCMQWVCLFFNVGSAVCGVISIALLVDAYSNYGHGSPTIVNQKPIPIAPQCKPLDKNFRYGAGFALLCTGFGLNILSVVFLLKG